MAVIAGASTTQWCTAQLPSTHIACAYVAVPSSNHDAHDIAVTYAAMAVCILQVQLRVSVC